MSTILYTSDPHFGHRLVAEHRGFETVEEHDTALIENWMKNVTKRDQVWVLGDICLSGLDHAIGILTGLPGEKHLISGNHDSCHPMHRNAHRSQERYLTAFASIQPFARHRICDQDVLLSHFPYARDRGPVRYQQYRLRDEGNWLLHGHTHGPEKRLGKEIHVGMDAWGLSPVPRRKIIELMEEAD